MHVENHRLVSEGVVHRTTPNLSKGLITPTLGVIHYTASSTLEGAFATLSDPTSNASAHVVIGRDGRIVQLAPFNRRAWHAGKSTWKGKPDVNSYSIGIELVNWGRLEQKGGGWASWTGAPVPSDQVITAAHKNSGGRSDAWQTYTEKQVRACAEVVRAINAAYKLDAEDWVGHDDIAPGRKIDPGPAWDWMRFRGLIDDRRGDEAADPVPAVDPFAALAVALSYKGGILSFSGSDAEPAARLLQRALHVEPDGVFGPKTWEAIARHLAVVARSAGPVTEATVND